MSPETSQWVQLNQQLLDRGEVAEVVVSMQQLPAEDETARNAQRTSIEYFQKNERRMRYACFRSQGLFIGSGVIEAGCKTIIGQRLKQSGMRWTVRGPMPSSPCVVASYPTAGRNSGKPAQQDSEPSPIFLTYTLVAALT